MAPLEDPLRRGFSCRPRPSAARLLPACAALVHKGAMLIQPLPDPAADREREDARRHTDQDTLELAAAGAAWTLGPDHSATKALTKASITMNRVDLWHAAGAQDPAARPARGDCRGAEDWGGAFLAGRK